MYRSRLLPTSLALLGPLALAQTSAPTHHTTSTPHHATAPAHRSTAARPAGPLCATLPPISPKIPALPASAGCPKVLFTVSDRLDYIAPIAERFKTSLFSELPVVISLDYAEIAPGTGELAKPQEFYTVKYTGWLTDGTKFDSSGDHDETRAGFTFPYGAHRVIAGWDLGFEGMRLGGKRRLYIPYQFAYGAAGKPPDIPAKSMLVFDMELLAQSTTPPAPPAPPAGHSAPGAPGAPGTLGAPGGRSTLPTTPPTRPTNPGLAPSTPPAPGTPTVPPPAPGEAPTPPKPGAVPPGSAPKTPATPGQPS